MKRAVPVLAISTFVIVVSANAVTIHVPADQPTIQAGINAAVNGDTVLVAPGTYIGDQNRDIDFLGKRIALISESGASATTIDCDGSAISPHRAFYLHSGEDSTALIQGFTITNAYDTAAAVYGAAAGVKLSGCVISGNSCSGVRRVQMDANWLVLENCTISGNTGDGVYVTRYFAIRNSEISHNTGRGVWAEQPALQSSVTYSVFAGNTLAGMAGWSFSGYMAEVQNCTFVGNYDGLACLLDLPAASEAAFPPEVRNSIFAFNRHYGYASGGYVQPVVKCSNDYGNGYRDWTLNPNDTLGKISANPLFCDTATGDFRLMDASPCAPAHNTCSVLIGALNVGCLCCPDSTGDINLSGVVDLSDLSALISYMTGSGYVLPCIGAGNVNAVGIIDLSDLSALISYLTGGGYILPHCP
ncbi:hypothetical protein C3F09_04035 [candidate division GN15 bacterium]|uniref:Right handed beta helix domain-containing protein n=1 Tax=candidate division GN15 bacterium TaxID=2072418 RepID=A0A855X9F3_9BACT|nr:MAG: hypothetical protein C3F09_04035 [candidate division GN15 bacterium]